ncbi:MAG TPA: hypothetical protein VME69_07840, partial [Methylocella sp.]|nr:hypothetical protein [Methylocella sp.]
AGAFFLDGPGRREATSGHPFHSPFALLRSGAMALSIARGGIRPDGRDILRILIAKAGFALDRLQTVVKGRKSAIRRAAGKVCAPLTVLLIALCLRAASEGVPSNKNCDRH